MAVKDNMHPHRVRCIACDAIIRVEYCCDEEMERCGRPLCDYSEELVKESPHYRGGPIHRTTCQYCMAKVSFATGALDAYA